jgi:hypothetical protein
MRDAIVAYSLLFDSVGVDKGFYSRVSRLGAQWLELDLHFLSLGGGEIALGWWFEECLVPYLMNTSRLEAVQSISIVTGYGKTRSRGARMNDDGMRLRVGSMLTFMKIQEAPQPNKGRIHINKTALVEEVKKNGGKIVFDLEGYIRWKEKETTANKFPDVAQQVRSRFRPAQRGEGPPGTFIREGGGNANEGYNHQQEMGRGDIKSESYPPEHRDSRRGPGYDDRNANNYRRSNEEPQDRRGSYNDRNPDTRGGGYGDDYRGGNDHNDRRGSFADQPPRRSSYGEQDGKVYGGDFQDKRNGYNEHNDRRGGYVDNQDKRGSNVEQRGRSNRDRDHRNNVDGRGSREYDGRSDRLQRSDDTDKRIDDSKSNMRRESSSYGDDRRGNDNGDQRHGSGHHDDYARPRHGGPHDRDTHRDSGFSDSGRNGGSRYEQHGNSGGHARIKSEHPPEQHGNSGGYARIKSEHPPEQHGSSGGYARIKSEHPPEQHGNSGGYARIKSEHPSEQHGNSGGYARIKSEHPSEQHGNSAGYARKSEHPSGDYRQNRASDSGIVHDQEPRPDLAESAGYRDGAGENSKKRPLEPQPNRGYNIEPSYSKRRNS